VSITATNPAKLFGLYPQKGPGHRVDADILVLSPRRRTTLSVATSEFLVDCSIYEGWSVAAALRCVFSRGILVVDDGSVKDVRGMADTSCEAHPEIPTDHPLEFDFRGPRPIRMGPRWTRTG
jgi:hypothetical protein